MFRANYSLVVDPETKSSRPNISEPEKKKCSKDSGAQLKESLENISRRQSRSQRRKNFRLNDSLVVDPETKSSRPNISEPEKKKCSKDSGARLKESLENISRPKIPELERKKFRAKK
ncbi:hypothetical protein GE061_020276 [Apolygus lucorum]|uniref:Uncharacterized protein n=1 Tax=Apolygus lucorum TaxID=248454 RepID=A0A8S9WM66_APOLU|nr:hypothetical protein GE061_020276 [Apolygus lucorum]